MFDNSFDYQAINILYRDVNGKRCEIRAENRHRLNYILQQENVLTEEDEILIVTWGKLLLYNTLDPMASSITKEDLVGFFA